MRAVLLPGVRAAVKHPLAHILTPTLSCEVVPGAITNRIKVIGKRGRDPGTARRRPRKLGPRDAYARQQARDFAVSLAQRLAQRIAERVVQR